MIMKQQVILKFPSVETLVAFSREALLRYYELNSSTCILRSECTQQDIELACTRFAAAVVQEPNDSARQAV